MPRLAAAAGLRNRFARFPRRHRVGGPQINELFRWEDQFGYELTGENGLNLDALRDGFEFDLQPGEGRVLGLRGTEEAFREDSYWLLSLLAIAHEYSTWQLALGTRFFVLLFLDRGSPLIGQQYESLGVPDHYWIHPRAEDPFTGSTTVPPGAEPPYAKLPVARSSGPATGRACRLPSRGSTQDPGGRCGRACRAS